MLRIGNRPWQGPLSPAIYASLALAFAGVGDAFLYPFLPVNFSQVSLPVQWVGAILSINRFIRIFLNTAIARLFYRYSGRTIFVAATLVAVLSTAGYALAGSVVTWLVLRICWGASFSALRTGTLDYALQHPRQGLALGLTRSLQELGPLLALGFASFVLVHLSTTYIFLLLAAVSIPAVFFALQLPPTKHDVPLAGKAARIPSSLDVITFCTAAVIDGVIVVTLGTLFLHTGGHISLIAATALSAFYLAYRKFCLVLLSPAGGWLADKIGLDKAFVLSTLLIIAGLAILISGAISIGAVVIFTAYSVHAAITPGSAAHHPHASRLSIVATNATWRDTGAAIGTLAGGMLITSPYLAHTIAGAAISLTILLLIHQQVAQKALKYMYTWK